MYPNIAQIIHFKPNVTRPVKLDLISLYLLSFVSRNHYQLVSGGCTSFNILHFKID